MEDVINQEQQQDVSATHDINITQNASGGMEASVTPKDPMAEPQQPQAPQQEKAPAPEQPEAEDVQQEVNQQLQTEQDLKADLQTRGVDFDALSDEFEKNGQLSQESLDKLSKAGYPKSVVDAYLNGMQATADRFAAQVKSFAGGDEAFAQMQKFIATQSTADINAFNSLIENGDLGQIKLAIQGIKAEMTQKYGTANPTVMGNGSDRGTPTGYTTTREMTKDMADPRYQVDPAFTREVLQKIKNSTIF